MRVRIVHSKLGLSDSRTRLPFRFGIVTLTAAPILTLALEVESEDARRAVGYAADLCVPKWFEKDPALTVEQDFERLIASARAAARAARGDPGAEHETAFELWLRLWHARVEAVPFGATDRLLRGFGVALVERALLDATCRLAERSFFQALREDLFGFRPGQLHAELAGAPDLPFEPPRTSIEVRHTVGMDDALTTSDVARRVDDGYPECLAEDVRRYGLTRFKLKLRGDADADAARLARIAAVLDAEVGPRATFTLDGNEQYADLSGLIALLERLRGEPATARFLEGLLYIEQPLPRALSFDPQRTRLLTELDAFAPTILDEADFGLEAFPRAVDLGYRGVSVKNCKGVFRALAVRALCARDERLFQSGEDLTNLPVLALQQDLATMAALGLGHVERNGHHYFRGLDHLPRAEAEGALAAHPDLYERTAAGIGLRIEDGRLALGSLDDVGYGYRCPIRFEERAPVDDGDDGADGNGEGGA